MARDDPYKGVNFLVEIDGISVAASPRTPITHDLAVYRELAYRV